MDDDAILRTQRELRRRLFEGPAALRWRPGRELAAQLLLYLDDPAACWRLTTDWLRDTLDADRVDAGLGGYVDAAGRPRHYVVLAETQRDAVMLPSVLGRRFDARESGLRAVWAEAGHAALPDVAQAAELTDDLRGVLRTIGVGAKFAVPLRDGRRPVGIVCADWHDQSPRWNRDCCLDVAAFAQQALGPLLLASTQLVRDDTAALAWPDRAPGLGRALAGGAGNVVDKVAGEVAGEVAGKAADGAAGPNGWASLTAAEQRVARLVANGLSYKEVARTLGRSLSTVDHQLRSIREKLGVRSTARLVHLLSGRGADDAAPPPRLTSSG